MWKEKQSHHHASPHSSRTNGSSYSHCVTSTNLLLSLLRVLWVIPASLKQFQTVNWLERNSESKRRSSCPARRLASIGHCLLCVWRFVFLAVAETGTAGGAWLIRSKPNFNLVSAFVVMFAAAGCIIKQGTKQRERSSQVEEHPAHEPKRIHPR